MHTYRKYGATRFWEVLDPAGSLVCLCVYKKGALEVLRRLNSGLNSDQNGGG